MTRSISINAHDLEQSAWDTLVVEVQAAISKARKAPGGAAVGGIVYDSHGKPQNYSL